jgi:hypothetical protein
VTVKYLLMVYSNPETWEHPMYARDPGFLALPESERDELIRQAEDLRREIVESGELVAGSALADPVTSRTIRVRDGLPATTDGPYIEAKEQLAGYFVLDCESLERACEIAARIPDARFTGVELRPIMSTAGQEM